MGIARACDGALIRQFRYGPYGELTGIDALQSDGTTLAALDADTPIDAWHLFQGMLYDEEFGGTHLDGAYYVNARTYLPALGRLIQRDPNGQALMLSSALAMNTQTQYALAGFIAVAQYNDGMNLYGFVRNNPNTGRDPSGQFSLMDVMTTQSLRSYLRTGGVLAGIGLAGAGVFGGIRSGYQVQLNGGTPREIATAAVLGAGFTGYKAFARVMNAV